MHAAADPAQPCPCGSGLSLGACCGLLHAGQPAASAQALMRSRYSAYVLDRRDYLMATWHATHRPATLDDLEPVQWLGLKVHGHRETGPDTAEVQFTARFRAQGPGGGRAERLSECSRFVREDGRWFYLDGTPA